MYCSVDEHVARPVLDRFERDHGIGLTVLFDHEAGKTTGLVTRIISEAKAGRIGADVFWSSEVFHTIRLAEMELLEPYESPEARDIPPQYKDPRHRWAGVALRARVLVYDPSHVLSENLPATWEELASPRFARHVAIANPLFGTTRGHVAAMFARWGRERGRTFLQGLRDGGALILDSNAATVRAVVEGRARYGCTDSDDVRVAQRGGASVAAFMPDMGDGGTLLIPCSICLLKGVKEHDSARRLVDYLLSPGVERMLAESVSGNWPVRRSLQNALNVSPVSGSILPLSDAAAAMDDAVAAVRELLIR